MAACHNNDNFGMFKDKTHKHTNDYLYGVVHGLDFRAFH